MPEPSKEDIEDLARQIAATENGCPCSGDDPPEPTAEQYEYARGILAKPPNPIVKY